MNLIEEQQFETINGLEIRCRTLNSANTVEILIENQNYLEHRTRAIRQILIAAVFCMLLNIVIQSHVIATVLNIVFIVTIATKCHILVNLIEFGKHVFVSQVGSNISRIW